MHYTPQFEGQKNTIITLLVLEPHQKCGICPEGGARQAIEAIKKGSSLWEHECDWAAFMAICQLHYQTSCTQS